MKSREIIDFDIVLQSIPPGSCFCSLCFCFCLLRCTVVFVRRYSMIFDESCYRISESTSSERVQVSVDIY